MVDANDKRKGTDARGLHQGRPGNWVSQRRMRKETCLPRDEMQGEDRFIVAGRAQVKAPDSASPASRDHGSRARHCLP